LSMNPVDVRPDDAESARAWLSALTDGRADAGQPAVAAWAHDSDARRTWHAYQLIGDVLRSEELASPGGRDEAFLQRFRARLDQEPVVLAPQSAPTLTQAPVDVGAGRGARRLSLGWSAAAALAGVALVGGAVFSLQRGGGEAKQLSGISAPAEQAQVAVGVRSLTPSAAAGLRAGGQPTGVPGQGSVVEVNTQQWHLLDERVLRDANLESYLRAHRGMAVVGGRVEPVALGR
jgi:sigma-E factor negative regulatory protein RseA